MFYFESLTSLSALICFIGHIFPIWLKFKGGKGVATYLGVILALSYKFFLIFGISWISLSLLFRFASLSSMISTLVVFLYAYFFEINNNILILFIFFVIILFTHKENILRLKSSTENKIKL
jgi:glycerol-3-phosphate acyltransferase PlsY